MAIQFRTVANLNHFSYFFHGPIPRQLSLRLGPGLNWRIPPRQSVEIGRMSADLRGDTQPNSAAAHLRQTDRGVPTVHLVLHIDFPAPDAFERPRDIPVPLHRVHAEV